MEFEHEYTPSFKLPKAVLDDKIKSTIIPAKIILECVTLWPEKQNRITRIVTFILFASLLFVLAGEIYFIYNNISNLASAAFSSTLVIAVIETIIRQFLINYYKNDLIQILNVIYYEFWPSHTVDEEIELKLGKKSLYIILYFSLYMLTAFICVVQLFMAPIITANGNLTLLSTYPFDYRKSPVYEILHTWHFFMGEVLVFTICGLDICFLAVIWNCIGQFIILRCFIQKEFEHNITNRGNGLKVLLKCIGHHQKIIRICKETEKVFRYFILLLFLTSIGTICISCFVATVIPKEIGTCGTYFVGHFCQLLIYCFMGTQLIYESTELSNAIFHCGWHLSNDISELKTPLLMLVARAQKEQHITAGGFAILNMSSFVQIIKLSFSVYTLLNSFVDK